MLDGVVPFPADLAERYRREGWWKDRPLGDVFRERFAEHGDRIALVAGDEHVTYTQLGERVDRLALHLLALGIGPLDRMVVQLPNVPQLIYLYFALQRVGAIPLMALPLHRHHEIGHFVDHVGAVAYAVPDVAGGYRFTDLAQAVRQGSKSLRHVLVVGPEVPEGCVSVDDLLATEPAGHPGDLDRLDIDPTDPCVFQLSGGTTGVPKVIPRTHNDYLYNSEASGAVNDIRPDDALLVVLPASHNFPLACPGIQAFLLAGARCVLSTSTRPDDALALVAEHRVTHLELVPALLLRWLHDPAFADHDLSSVRVVNTGGQKLQPEVKRRTEAMTPTCTVQEVFGMAEGLLLYVRLDDPEEVRYETAGRPVSPGDELQLLDDDGNEVAEGETGELAVRGPYTLHGYYRAPDHNAASFTDDGFYLTGDLLRRHPSGNYVVEGRKKDLINRGGEKISAEEVENLILGHPAVRNVACVPMPDPVLGERMCAFVVVADGTTLDLAAVTTFLAEKGMAKFKWPERLEMLDELPASPFGKVSKKDLVERIAAQVAAEQQAH